MSTKQNCWDYTSCGKEKECPAYPDFGKSCYSKAGTLCWGEIQGDYEAKVSQCRDKCSFYKYLMG